ncbi:MAG: hypothetical protein ACFFD4_12670 [Candidatus Odinarchaeota archaeon]
MEINSEQKRLLLKGALWIGIVLDGLFALDMTVVGMFGTITVLTIPFTTIEAISMDYRYALLVAAGTMWGWTALLGWAAMKPVERKDIALITAVPVIIVEMVANLFAGMNELFTYQDTLLKIGVQTLLLVMFVISYFINRNQD